MCFAIHSFIFKIPIEAYNMFTTKYGPKNTNHRVLYSMDIRPFLEEILSYEYEWCVYINKTFNCTIYPLALLAFISSNNTQSSHFNSNTYKKNHFMNIYNYTGRIQECGVNYSYLPSIQYPSSSTALPYGSFFALVFHTQLFPVFFSL